MTEETAEQYIERRKAQRAYREWQARVRKNLPEWGVRVFALRGKAYCGHGYHSQLEHTYGAVVRIATSEVTPRDAAERLIDEVIVEAFVEDVVKAEQSAAALKPTES